MTGTSGTAPDINAAAADAGAFDSADGLGVSSINIDGPAIAGISSANAGSAVSEQAGDTAEFLLSRRCFDSSAVDGDFRSVVVGTAADTGSIPTALGSDSSAVNGDPAFIFRSPATADPGSFFAAAGRDRTAVDLNVLVSAFFAGADTGAIFRTGSLDRASMDRDIAAVVVLIHTADAGAVFTGGNDLPGFSFLTEDFLVF